MRPAVAVGFPSVPSTSDAGNPRFTLLNRLKTSTRIWIERLPHTLWFLTNDASTVAVPGPIRVFLPRLPMKPACGRTNAFGSKYVVAPPSTGLFDAPGFRSGTSNRVPDARLREL